MVTFTATHFAYADASSLILKYNKPECRIGYSVGSSGMYLVEKYFDKAQKIPLESIPTAHSALLSSKIDTFVQSRATMQYAITSGLKSVYVADCNIGDPTNICIGISPKNKFNDLKEKLDEFIKDLQTKGILQKIIDKWLNESYAKMPDLPEPTNPERTLIVGTTGTLPPFSFYSDNTLTGLDIEFIKRFAYYYNAKIVYKIYDFNGIVSAAEAGAIDCIATHLMETEERKKAINFSIPYFKEHNGFMLKTESESELTSFQQLENMRIAVIGTTVSKELILQKAPNAKNFCNYSSNIDGIEAVKSKKADCYVDDEPILRLLASRNKGIKVAPLIISKFKYGIALKKNNPLTEKITRIVEKFREQGILDELKEIWTGKDESKRTIKTIPNQTWEGQGKRIKISCTFIKNMF